MSARELSVVVPTRNEAASIGPFLAALLPALDGIDAEVIFVDDSSDDTPSVVQRHADVATLPVQVRHRVPGERADGLGGAVKLGFEAAEGALIAVMDVDLQHPPALLRPMVAAAMRGDTDLVIGSRFTGGAGVGDFGLVRRAVSRGSSTLARLLFPRRLRQVSDPMSGYFLVRRERLAIGALRPHGFKILLEVLVRSERLRITEVPYTFGERVAGTSKASLREGCNYLVHLVRLRLGLGGAKLRALVPRDERERLGDVRLGVARGIE
jgi:glycosyltransferase involved in cell wall biosynthesis